jgi:hypothetical protein
MFTEFALVNYAVVNGEPLLNPTNDMVDIIYVASVLFDKAFFIWDTFISFYSIPNIRKVRKQVFLYKLIAR